MHPPAAAMCVATQPVQSGGGLFHEDANGLLDLAGLHRQCGGQTLTVTDACAVEQQGGNGAVVQVDSLAPDTWQRTNGDLASGRG